MRFARPVRALVAVAALAVAVGLGAGCGSKSPTATPVTAPATAPHSIEKAAPNPSVSAKMICGEAKPLIAASAVGFDTSEPLRPTWKDHVYACDYVYSGGARMRLSVKEMSSLVETSDYFTSLQQRYASTTPLSGLGEGAFQAPDGSVGVRKDYRVLLIDVSKLPEKFGSGSTTRNETAISVAATVMGCWTGA